MKVEFTCIRVNIQVLSYVSYMDNSLQTPKPQNYFIREYFLISSKQLAQFDNYFSECIIAEWYKGAEGYKLRQSLKSK